MRGNIFILGFLLFVFTSTKGQDINFKTTILKIQNDITETQQKGVEDGWYGVIGIPDLLLMIITQDEDIYHIFSHPAQYKEEIMNYINNDSVKWEFKYLALGMLQGLCFEEYMAVAETVYNLYNTRIINPPIDLSKPISRNNYNASIDVLRLSINQDNLSLEVVTNYKKDSLRRLLHRIMNNEMVPMEIKTYCTRVLNGFWYQQKKMLISKHLIPTPLVQCKNGNPYFYPFSFFSGQ